MTTVLQLSDSHLLPPGEKLYKQDVDANFMATIAAAKAYAPFDLVILTGDIAEDGSIATYQRTVDILQDLRYQHLIAIPGNHDVPENMLAVMPMAAIDIGPWRVLPVNSHWEAHPEGEISVHDLEALQTQLQQSEAFTLVAVHHPPHYPCTKRQCGLSNKDALLALTGFASVRLVISGHVHDDYTHRVGSTLFSTCPSTCIGFDHDPKGHSLRPIKPGAIIYDLGDDGSIGRRAIYT
jgi:Icc protein